MKKRAINTLHFEKISKYDRQCEPVTVSIPFDAGRLVDPSRLVIRDGDNALPIQTGTLAQWPDGSVKWLLVHFQPDLPGNADKTLNFEVADDPVRPPLSASVSVARKQGGVQVDTGVLSFLIPDDGYAPLAEVRLGGAPVLGGDLLGGFRARLSGRELSTMPCSVELEVEESGPLRAVVLVRGRHRDAEGGDYLELRGRVTAYAGKTYVEIEHQFLHTETDEDLLLESLSLSFQAPETAAPKFALGEGYYRTGIRKAEGAEAVDMAIDAETIIYQSCEHYVDSFYGDFWVDWTGEDAGLAISIHQAHQNFPKALRAAPDGLLCSLMPDGQPAVRVIQGMGKTHRLMLHFHAPQVPLDEISTRSLQFQIPDRPSLTREWLAQNNPWRETLFPESIPDRLITYFTGRHDSRPTAMGMMHFGDAPDAGYTDQGRGRGLVVWVNNEYDRPHACTLFYGLTGLRRSLDSGLVCARHWMDVDLCHYSPDPLKHGGLKIHTATTAPEESRPRTNGWTDCSTTTS